MEINWVVLLILLAVAAVIIWWAWGRSAKPADKSVTPGDIVQPLAPPQDSAPTIEPEAPTIPAAPAPEPIPAETPKPAAFVSEVSPAKKAPARKAPAKAKAPAAKPAAKAPAKAPAKTAAKAPAAKPAAAPKKAAAPVAKAAPAPRKAPAAKAPAKPKAAAKPKAPDNLLQLKGVGPKLATLLNGLGVNSFAQIAAWTPADVERIDGQLGTFKGRITRDLWIEQAGYLAKGDIKSFEAKFGKLDSEN